MIIIGEQKIQNKIKPLLTSLREKKRYLAFEILSEAKIEDFNAVSNAIWAKSLEYLGELGCAKAGILVLPDKYDTIGQKGLLKVSNRSLNEVKAALCLIDSINGKRAIVRTTGVSGILRKAHEKYIAK